MSAKKSPHVAYVSSYVPRQCGIATFTNDVASSVAKYVHDTPIFEDENISVVAMNDEDAEYHYGPQVVFEIRQHQRSDYRNAADFINTGPFDVVNLQHEYGLYGGDDGSYVIEFLGRLKKPIVSTFHTVLSQPSPGQRNTLAAIAEHSTQVVVLAERAKMLCHEVYGMPADKVRLIHHGTPDVEFHNPDDFKDKFLVKDRPVLLTFGLLSPGKGIENMVDALALVAKAHPNVAYMILGATHPAIRRESGEAYRLGLESRAVDHGISKNVFFHNHYVTLPVLVEFLKAADIYVTPYLNKEQIVSGTLAYAVACGKAIVSTPYYYAQEMLADGRGFLAEFGKPESLADNIIKLLDDNALRRATQEKAYAFGRKMIWSEVARQYEDTFQAVEAVGPVNTATVKTGEKPGLQLSLPDVRLDHLYRLTDGTGMLQHAIYSTPNRHHGYCTDDNSRALIVATMSYRLLRDAAVLPFLDRYLSFMHYAWNEDRKRFHNFMSYDRKWLDDEGTDDCLGRCVWSLGYLIAHPPADQNLSLAIELFNKASGSTSTIRSPRACALCLIGFHYYLRAFGGADDIRDQMRTISQFLVRLYDEQRTDDWAWLEPALTYDNARIPQALLLAARTLEDDNLRDCGIASLKWLLESQTSNRGQLSPVGNKGWWVRGESKAQFDQQPIDAGALVEACKSAYKSTNDPMWLESMRWCFEWFLGRNDINMPLADFKTRGCADGLCQNGINPNQGAESTLAWYLSLLTMYEMYPAKVV